MRARRADPGVLGGRRSWQLPPLLAGKPASNYADLEADQVVMGNEVANCSAEVRAGFIRKVYGILAIQLVVTFGAQRSSPPASAPPALSVRSLGAMCSVG